MPPKKAAAPTKRVVLGRPGTSLQMGIVGVPNAGKSTFFNVLTKSSIPADPHPYCTVKPNTARVPIPDPRYDTLVKMYDPKSREKFAWLNIMDIAGLCRDAAAGEGLGNVFLGDVAAVDGIYMMLRCFDKEDVPHVEGTVDPVRDIELVNHELLLKDKEWVGRRLESLRQQVTRGGQKDKQGDLDMLEKIAKTLEDETLIRNVPWSDAEIKFLNTLNLLTAKSVVYLCNISARDYARKSNKWLPKVKEWVDANTKGEELIPFSAEFESEWLQCEGDEARLKEYIATLPSSDKVPPPTTALPRIITTGFKTLDLIYFFTAGADEVAAWIIKNGDLAPQAAGRIHTDFEKGFQSAEVVAYDDLVAEGSEAAAKATGKYRQQGRTYEVKDGDVIYFRVNTAGLKGKGK